MGEVLQQGNWVQQPGDREDTTAQDHPLVKAELLPAYHLAAACAKLPKKKPIIIVLKDEYLYP